MGQHAQYRALVALFLVCAAGPAAAGCRLALALGFDVSRSVDAADYAIQRDGLLAALADPVIVDAFLKPEEPVALALYEWSGQAHQDVVVDWRLIEGPGDLAAVAAAVAGHERAAAHLPTGLGTALDFGRALVARAPDCAAHTLDLSGDGRSNDGDGPREVYAKADFGDLMVNGLAIGGHEADIAIYYRREVIRGPGAFVEVARRHTDFPRAIRRKLERELTEQLIGGAPAADHPG